MEKKSVLSTLRFVFFTIISLVLIFSAVLVTVLNTYKPVVKAYIDENEKDKKRNERTLAKYIGDGKHHIIGKWTATYEE